MSAYLYFHVSPEGETQGVGVYSDSSPTCRAGEHFMSSPYFPPRKGQSYSEDRELMLESCRNFSLRGRLGDAIRTLGETGNYTPLRSKPKRELATFLWNLFDVGVAPADFQNPEYW